MDTRENFLRAAEMKGPEWIPCTVSISPPLWHRYRGRMEDVVLKHPAIFGGYQKESRNFDDFGIRHKLSLGLWMFLNRRSRIMFSVCYLNPKRRN